MHKPLATIILLVLSNTFMTLAWYGHLKFSEWKNFQKLGLFAIVLISWGIAFFEYCFQVPANKYGFKANGGAFSLVELKVLQEVITLGVFLIEPPAGVFLSDPGCLFCVQKMNFPVSGCSVT
jgi:uncharacterized protein